MPIQKKPQDRRSRKKCTDQASETAASQVLTDYILDRKDDGVQAMERLRSVYLLAFLALAAVPAAGQQPAPPDPNAPTFAVVGDIENCRTYPIPTGSTLTVRQAVLNAGLVSEFVNVMLIRSAQDVPQRTQFVSATSSDNGERVGNGDVLVVQSMSPLTAAVRKNAALRSDLGVAFVSLEQDGIVIGDVLQATQTLPPADGQLKVICRFSEQTPIAKAELYHSVAHGDVISISRSDRAVLTGFGNKSPTVSERKSSGPKVARDPFIPMTLPASNHSFASSPSMFQSLQLPESPEPLMVLPVPDGDSAKADAAVPDHAEEAPAVRVSALSISQAEDVGDSSAVDSKIRFAAESMDVAPTAPSEIQIGEVANRAATAFNLWNLIFIGGLLLAGTLILAGTVKPESEDDATSSKTAGIQKASDGRHVGAPPASHGKWTESPGPHGKWTESPGPLSVAMPVSQTAATLTKIEPAVTHTPPIADSSGSLDRALHLLQHRTNL